jgi:hypothetical protein
MGGVGTSALDIGLFSCAETTATKRRTPKHTMTTRLLDFIRCFYQKRLDVCRKMFAETEDERGNETAQVATNPIYNPALPPYFLSSNGGFRWPESEHCGW